MRTTLFPCNDVSHYGLAVFFPDTACFLLNYSSYWFVFFSSLVVERVAVFFPQWSSVLNQVFAPLRF